MPMLIPFPFINQYNISFSSTRQLFLPFEPFPDFLLLRVHNNRVVKLLIN